MARRARVVAELSEKEALIAATLRRSGRPLSAYDLIELLHDDGVSSPPTVYRALKRLVGLGVAHRIESLNAFVSCAHGGHASTAAFAICGDCGGVTEFHQQEVARLLKSWAQVQAFALSAMTIELHGTCSVCAAAQGGSDA